MPQEIGAAVGFVITNVLHAGSIGPPLGPLKCRPVAGMTASESGRSKASRIPSVVQFGPSVAPSPIPRSANAAQISDWLAPVVSKRSAKSIASRSCKYVGFGGDSFSASVTICSVMSLPLGNPYLRMRFARTSQSVTHHNSPIRCGSSAPAGLNG